MQEPNSDPKSLSASVNAAKLYEYEINDPVLIVDDDPVQRRLSEAVLLKAGMAVQSVPDGQAALDALAEGRYSAVLLDMMMPGLDGYDVLQAIAKRGIAIPVVVQTAQGSIEAAVRMIRAGAFDFLVKPVSPERLVKAVGAASKVSAMEPRARHVRSRAAERFSLDDLTTHSPWMEKVIRLSQRAATSDIPVLIEGESGVGKEMVARAIQSHSQRRGKPFIIVNCGAIPEKLVESILFGHEKGAFTGANERHDGKFAEADGGTLFLDEIGELPMDVQVKLLRAVQFNEIDPVGSKRPRNVDVRLISATNKNLIDAIKAGKFREDLFYRLNVFPVYVPPLRERREDISQLATLFVKRYAHVTPGAQARAISDEAMRLLEGHDWPGNVRELENAVHRAVVLSDVSHLTPEHFPHVAAQNMPVEKLTEATVSHVDDGVGEGINPSIVPGAPGADAPMIAAPKGVQIDPDLWLQVIADNGHIRRMEDIESDLIRMAIAHYGGQLSEVARRLGIGRSTLYRKLGELGLESLPSGIDASNNPLAN
jgi:DNA-binding NtrC family response regulator